jgi:hypothetical protein
VEQLRVAHRLQGGALVSEVKPLGPGKGSPSLGSTTGNVIPTQSRDPPPPRRRRSPSHLATSLTEYPSTKYLLATM